MTARLPRPKEAPEPGADQNVAPDFGAPRQPFHGMFQILRFNWPWYAAAMGGLLMIAVLLPHLELTPLRTAVAVVGVGCGLFWAGASLLVSHWVYDCSPLCHWRWLADLFAESPARVANIHAGFDETSLALRRIFPAASLVVWDIYEPSAMTEGSIARARGNRRWPIAAAPVDFRGLPATDNALRAVFLIFAAHEIRCATGRERFFGEMFRVLGPGGSLVLVEHLRDWRNALAYGPGVFHFLPRSEWLRLARLAGFRLAREFSVTPFVRVFLLNKTR